MGSTAWTGPGMDASASACASPARNAATALVFSLDHDVLLK